jgi:hypothetical protein
MKIELIQIHDTDRMPIYYVLIDGVELMNSESGRYEDVLLLYDRIIADPNYLNTRKTVVKSDTIQ